MTARTSAPAPEADLPACLECGYQPADSRSRFCRRCGLAYGAPPRPFRAPTCPVCYRDAASDGRFDPLLPGGGRVDLVRHIAEHELRPVGDDEFLETLREGDMVRVGRWRVPYDLLRRYLVLGLVDAGRSRRFLHNALIVAMGQVARWGVDVQVVGDEPEWADARHALVQLMERYHRHSPAT